MNAGSRSVFAPTVAAFAAAARPAARSAGEGGAQIGWYQVIAMPQWAMPHCGSRRAASSKGLRDSS